MTFRVLAEETTLSSRTPNTCAPPLAPPPRLLTVPTALCGCKLILHAYDDALQTGGRPHRCHGAFTGITAANEKLELFIFSGILESNGSVARIPPEARRSNEELIGANKITRPLFDLHCYMLAAGY